MRLIHFHSLIQVSKKEKKFTSFLLIAEEFLKTRKKKSKLYMLKGINK